MSRILCFFGFHERIISTSSYKVTNKGLTKMVKGKKCINCGKVRWDK